MSCKSSSSTRWLGVAFVLFQACATSAQFTRVETLPQGDQVNVVTGALFGGMTEANVVEFIYAAPYEKVWPAIKRVAERFDKLGKRPVVAVDEKNGRVQNGAITESALIGLGTGAWRDEFVMEATALADNRTKVSVSRRVVELELISGGTAFRAADRRWRTQFSNGQIEAWLHTQIYDELAKAQ